MFYNPALFEFTKEFECHWQAIRDEYLQLDNRILDIHRHKSHEAYIEQLLNNNGWIPSWQVGSSKPNYDWLTYVLSYRGLFPSETATKFPITASLLAKLSGLRVCAFSLMKPSSFIAPHKHPELGGNFLTYHLGIDLLPGKSYLWSNNRFEEQCDRKSIIFDGSYDHSAFNLSDKNRVVLYLEFDKTKISCS